MVLPGIYFYLIDRTFDEMRELFKLQDVQFKGDTNRHIIDKIMTAVTRQHAMALDTSYVDDVNTFDGHFTLTNFKINNDFLS